MLPLAGLNDEVARDWAIALPFAALLPYSYPPPLAGSVALALLRKQKEALRLNANIEFTVGPKRPRRHIAIVGYNVHKPHVYINIIYIYISVG